jgi:hypothetical protein
VCSGAYGHTLRCTAVSRKTPKPAVAADGVQTPYQRTCSDLLLASHGVKCSPRVGAAVDGDVAGAGDDDEEEEEEGKGPQCVYCSGTAGSDDPGRFIWTALL